MPDPKMHSGSAGNTFAGEDVLEAPVRRGGFPPRDIKHPSSPFPPKKAQPVNEEKHKRRSLKKKRRKVKKDLSREELAAAANNGLSKAAKETMELMGFNVIVKDGWVVKLFADGRIEKIREASSVRKAG